MMTYSETIATNAYVLGQEHCGDVRHSYRCTRTPGHDGDHISYGQVGQIVRWPNE